MNLTTGQTIFVIQGKNNFNYVTEYVVDTVRTIRVTEVEVDGESETTQTQEFTLVGVEGAVFNTEQVVGYFYDNREAAQEAATGYNTTNLNHYSTQIEQLTKLRAELVERLA